MIWIIGILTVILVLNSLLLVLLILVQLPKKEAGMGTAFGGGTTDALFGAGTGNALTKITKYCTVVFFVLTLSLSILNAQRSKAEKTQLEEAMKAATTEDVMNPDTGFTPPPANPGGSVTTLLDTATNGLPDAAGQPEASAEPPEDTPAPAEPEAQP